MKFINLNWFLVGETRNDFNMLMGLNDKILIFLLFLIMIATIIGHWCRCHLSENSHSPTIKRAPNNQKQWILFSTLQILYAKLIVSISTEWWKLKIPSFWYIYGSIFQCLPNIFLHYVQQTVNKLERYTHIWINSDNNSSNSFVYYKMKSLQRLNILI